MKSKEQKRLEAEERNARWRAMSDKEKLRSLIERGHGNCKQAKKLARELGIKAAKEES